MTLSVHELFSRRFDGDATSVVRSPGRVNLIGEHTDYNDGFVSPMAIDRQIDLAVRPRDDGQVVLYSGESTTAASFAVDDLARVDSWGVYPQGVVRAFADDGLAVRGFEGVLVSDIPGGSGLSSSAALELAVARALADITDLEWDAVDMALRCVRAENEWVGVACGVMDQMICATGVEGSVSRIDCRDYSTTPVVVADDVVVMVLHTGTKRGLLDSEYNARRATCIEAASELGVGSLRDASVEQVENSALEGVTLARARHVVSENQRVLDWGEAMEQGRWADAGRLMVQSHESLRDDYEVSGPALDAMVDLALETPGVYGARLTGAGFAGAAVALADASAADDAAQSIAQEFPNRYDSEPLIIPSRPRAGTSLTKP